ncbi:hypothetical protein RX327_24375 [Bradyrhizobium sp. BEA-2-5]|uniref:hypothetical protein n=1 Tax=Bradyrhizobium sp. BEA-2-5 TaxID=3080015 RepID=UPI00293E235F|nr:hypothetical protein [Bradyrhizobium sp. BEA-2-5]WOH79040.1 hypothetical protein RX327_24375 [Bradyrhizobium sp. BEA-2-5]
MSVRTFLPYLLAYAIGAICTFGIFYRDQQQVPLGRKQLVATIAWPVWWPIAKGLAGIFDAIDHVALATDGRKMISLAIGLFAGGHCLSSGWGECVGTVACTGVVAMSAAVFLPPLNFIYVTWLAMQPLL